MSLPDHGCSFVCPYGLSKQNNPILPHLSAKALDEQHWNLHQSKALKEIHQICPSVFKRRFWRRDAGGVLFGACLASSEAVVAAA